VWVRDVAKICTQTEIEVSKTQADAWLYVEGSYRKKKKRAEQEQNKKEPRSLI